MLFDDAEGLADPKADPDKEALILAGNPEGGQSRSKRPGLTMAYAMAECLLPTRIDSYARHFRRFTVGRSWCR